MDGSTLEGETAIVTGAGRNIGRAIAERFARAGARVAVADISERRAEQTVATITGDGNEATPVVVDISEEADVRRMVETVEATYGPADVLVNNAAVMEDETPFLDQSVAEFDRVVEVNLRGTFLCTREVAASMRGSGGGRIVNLASTSGHRGRPDAVAYATTKSGIRNFTRSAAKALADHDIRVNTLTPTRTGSRTLDPSVTEAPDEASVEEDPELTEAFRRDVPVGRLGDPEDHAAAALFLVSDDAAFVTGTELVVDGGRSA